MNLAQNLRFLWSGVRGRLGRRGETAVVVCPTAAMPAEVGLDGDRRMESCSRWPKLKGCNESCMPQVHFSAEGVDDFTARYENKNCASCGALLTLDDWYKSRLAAVYTKTETPGAPMVVRSSSVEKPQDGDPMCSGCYAAPTN